MSPASSASRDGNPEESANGTCGFGGRLVMDQVSDLGDLDQSGVVEALRKLSLDLDAVSYTHLTLPTKA